MAAKLVLWPIRLALFAVGLIVSASVLINAASTAFQNTSPELAIKLNPLNTNASVNLALEAAQTEAEKWPAEVAAEVQRAKKLAPGDARLYSLMGVVAEQNGEAEEAEQFFREALILLPTEYQALVRRFVSFAAQQKHKEASQLAEVLIRRRSVGWQIILPVLYAMVQQEAALNVFAEELRDFPKGRSRVINAMTSTPEYVGTASSLILRWHAAEVPNLERLIQRVTNTLIRAGRVRDAHALFLQTRVDDGDGVLGYVHNSTFSKPLGGNLFNWMARRQTGVTVKQKDKQERGGDSHVSVRFLGNPLNLNNLNQYLRLPAGSYTVSADYQTSNLKTPKPIELVLSCSRARRELARMQLAPNNGARTSVQASFSVPLQNCDLPLIRLTSEFVALSWRNRFEGELKLYSVKIQKAD